MSNRSVLRSVIAVLVLVLAGTAVATGGARAKRWVLAMHGRR